MMNDSQPGANQVVSAARSLLSDIEGMFVREDGMEAFYGPFSWFEEDEEGATVSWYNLFVSAQKLRRALEGLEWG